MSCIMQNSLHANRRIEQRGIRQSYIELVEAFGARKGDKLLLGEKGLRRLIEVIDEKARALGKV